MSGPTCDVCPVTHEDERREGKYRIPDEGVTLCHFHYSRRRPVTADVYMLVGPVHPNDDEFFNE